MDDSRKMLLIGATTTAGNVAGILLAVKRKSGFWGGVGWFLVGGMAGWAIGATAAAFIPSKKSESEVEELQEKVS